MDCDVLVAGGGPAGAVAALCLARRGLAVLMVNRGRDGGRRIGETLPGAARPLLGDLGLLDLVECGGHAPSPGNLFAWTDENFEANDAIRQPYGTGWHLDRARFDHDLRRAAGKGGVEILDARVGRVERWKDGWEILLDGPDGARSICADALIDATGRRAHLARGMGSRRRRDDDLVALHTWYRGSYVDPDHRTLIEAASEGWWYSARLPDGARVVALHLDAARAAEILRTPDEWRKRLEATRHIGAGLVGATAEVPPHGTEACGAQTLPAFGHRWLAVGDAALSFDPLSSQGLLTALFTGWKGAMAVAAGLDRDMAPLGEYAQRLDTIRSRYLKHRALVYRSVTRFGQAPFWAARSLARA